MKQRFQIENLCIQTQLLGGSTFEDELFLANDSNAAVAIELLEIVASSTVCSFAKKFGITYSKWNDPEAQKEIDGRSMPFIKRLLNEFNAAISSDPAFADEYKRLFFAELFLHYAESQKGDTALDLLTDDSLSKKLVVPSYIKVGLLWLLK